jgi:inner membrane transporter RhtA
MARGGAGAGPGVAAPAFAILGSMVSTNLGAAFAKSLFAHTGSAGMTALRVGMAAIILVLAWRPWRRLPPRAALLELAVYGLMLGCMNLLIYRAFSLIPIGVAVAIETVGPLAVVLASSRRPRDLAWLGCAAAGLVLLAPWRDDAAFLDPWGVACALGAAFCWAMYIVFGKRVAHATGGASVAWGMLVAALFTVPFGVAQAGAALFTPSVLAAGLAVALLSSALPYSLEMLALQRLPRRVFGMLVSAGPAVAALAGFVVLGERLAALQWCAIALVIAACAGSARAAGS